MADGVKELRQECRVHYSQLEKKSHQKGEGQEKESQIPIIVKYVIITWHLAVLLTDVGLLPSISLQLGLLLA